MGTNDGRKPGMPLTLVVFYLYVRLFICSGKNTNKNLHYVYDTATSLDECSVSSVVGDKNVIFPIFTSQICLVTFH